MQVISDTCTSLVRVHMFFELDTTEAAEEVVNTYQAYLEKMGEENIKCDVYGKDKTVARIAFDTTETSAAEYTKNLDESRYYID